MVLDTRDYAVLAELNPGADLGPFEPGVSFVDVEAVGDESPDLLAALVGQGLADPGELADRLPEALDGVEQSGRSFTGTASYADLLEARDAFAETVWTLETIIRFEVVDDLQMAPVFARRPVTRQPPRAALPRATATIRSAGARGGVVAARVSARHLWRVTAGFLPSIR